MHQGKLIQRGFFKFIPVLVAICFLASCQSINSITHNKNRSFSIVVLPDTQNYTDSSYGGSPELFYQQTQWIKDNKEKLNIVMVAHVGDIVQNPDQAPQWEMASDAFKTIDNEVPYIFCLGNHDIAKDQSTANDARATLLNDYFPPSRFTGNPLYNKNFSADKEAHFMEPGKSDNYYLYFKGGAEKFLIIALEFKPRDKVLVWANQVVSKHPDHRCIVLTHGYLNAQGKQGMGKYGITGNYPPLIWDKLVSKHPNMFMVLCGHILGEAISTCTGESGNKIHQILVDYQNGYIGNGGHGFLRIMTFYPDQNIIENKSYSPSLDVYINRDKSSFTLEYPDN